MIGELVAKLIAAGTAPEIAAAVVAEAFAAGVSSASVRVTSADESVTRRREKDRIRQQIRRDNLRTSADFRDNPQMSQNASLSKEDKKEDNQERERQSRPASRGQRLPDDWRPNPHDHATANSLIGDLRARSELEKFRDHWKQQPGSKGVKLDWDAAWRNWIRRAAEFGERNGSRTGPVRAAGTAGPPPTGDDAVVAGMARALERRRAARGAIDPGRKEFRADGGDGFTGGNAAEPVAAAGDGGSHHQLALIPRRDG